MTSGYFSDSNLKFFKSLLPVPLGIYKIKLCIKICWQNSASSREPSRGTIRIRSEFSATGLRTLTLVMSESAKKAVPGTDPTLGMLKIWLQLPFWLQTLPRNARAASCVLNWLHISIQNKCAVSLLIIILISRKHLVPLFISVPKGTW